MLRDDGNPNSHRDGEVDLHEKGCGNELATSLLVEEVDRDWKPPPPVTTVLAAFENIYRKNDRGR